MAFLFIFYRRVYQNLSFFLFFYYILTGLYRCTFRVLTSICINVFYIARMDKPLLIPGFERFDIGMFLQDFQIYSWILKIYHMLISSKSKYIYCIRCMTLVIFLQHVLLQTHLVKHSASVF